MKIIQTIAFLKSAKKHKDIIPGGLADKKKPSDFKKKELDKGKKVEQEHTKNRQMAQEIAMDHLTEKGDYYSRLDKAGL